MLFLLASIQSGFVIWTRTSQEGDIVKFTNKADGNGRMGEVEEFKSEDGQRRNRDRLKYFR